MLLLRQFVMEWRLYSRDRVAMFWTFAFPVLLLLGFGTIFRSGVGPRLDPGGGRRRRQRPPGRDLLAGPGATAR